MILLLQLADEQRLPSGSCEVLLFVRHYRRHMMVHAQVGAKVEHGRSQQSRLVKAADTVRGAHQAQSCATASAAAAIAAAEDILNGRRLQQPLQHTAGATMLQAFVRGQ